MANKPRSGMTGWQKILLWAVGIFVLWQITVSDTVGNGLLGFFLGGEVPGTAVVLSPEVILFGTLGVAVCILAVVIGRIWAGHRRVQHFRQITDEQNTVASEPSVAAVIEPAEVVKQPKAPTKKPASATSQLPLLPARVRQMAKRVARQSGPWLQRTGKRLRTTGSRVAVHSIGLYELTRMGVLYASRWIGRHLVSLAQWSSRKAMHVYSRLREWVKRAKVTTMPFMRKMAAKLKAAAERFLRWLLLRYNDAIKLLHKLAVQLKRWYRKSPVPTWLTNIQQRFHAPDQSDK